MNKQRLFIVLCFIFWWLVSTPAGSIVYGQQLEWTPVVTNGQGSGIIDFRETIVFKEHMYAVGLTGEISQLWRTEDGRNWERVNLEAQMENTTIYILRTYNNMLYAGTASRATMAELWESPDGLNWTRIVENGFGELNMGFYSMVEFDGYIYAGMGCDWGCQIWRTQDFSAWEKVSTNGFGNINNNTVTALEVFNGVLYAGTNKWTDGCEVWRSVTGSDWERVVANGFGNREYNDVVADLKAFGDSIYAACMTHVQGFEIWKSTDGVNWEMAAPKGFGDPENTHAVNTWCHITKHREYLYAVTILARNVQKGAQVWRTGDGLTWQRVSDYGFGNSNNTSFWSLEVFNGDLYVTTINRADGAEIWTNSRCEEGVITATAPTGEEYPCGDIQEAVDMAGENWKIEVESGEYNETVLIKDKTGVTIKTECEARVNGGFILSRNNNVVIDGFKINAAGMKRHGITLKGGISSNTNTTIRNCEIFNADTAYSGISAARGNPGTIIENNNIHHNGRNGICFIDASGGPHTVMNNTITSNGWNGVKVGREHEITLIGNTITGNGTNPNSIGGRYGINRGGVPGSGRPEGITLIDNTIKDNNGKIEAGKHSLDLGSYHQILDSTDYGNCTTAGDEGTGVSPCGE